VDDKQRQLEEDVEALKELVSEVSQKYKCYINVFCFPGGTVCTNDVQVGV